MIVNLSDKKFSLDPEVACMLFIGVNREAASLFDVVSVVLSNEGLGGA